VNNPVLAGGRSRQALLAYGALLPILGILLSFILYPTLNTIVASLSGGTGFSLEHYHQFLTYRKNMDAFVNTILLGLATVVVCGTIGTALAFFVHSFEFPGWSLIDVLLLSPFLLPGVTITIAFMQLYGESGLVTKTVQTLLGLKQPPFVLEGFWGILFVHAYTQYIFFYINVSAALKRFDNALIEVAQNLGASRLRIFFTVLLPMLIPALIAASVLTFMSGVGSFAAPSLLGGSFRVMSVQILMSKVNNFLALAAVQGIMLSLVSVVFLLLMRWVESRRSYTVATKGAIMSRRVIRHPLVRTLFVAGALTLTLIILLPVLAIVLIAFVKPGTWVVQIYPDQFGIDNFRNFFSRRRVYQPFVNSISMAAWASGLAVVVGSVASYVITKTRLKIRWLMEVLIVLPWALPASTVAVNMITAFNRASVFSLYTVLVGTYWILPLTYFVTMLTLIVRSTSASMLQMHRSLEEASRGLGAGWATTFRRIVVPIVAPGIAAGGVLGFIGAMGEYTSSALMYTLVNMPISVAMVNALYNFDIGLSMTYGALQIALTLTLVALARRLGCGGEFRF